MPELAPEVRQLIGSVEEMMATVATKGPAGGGTMDSMRVAALAATEEIFKAAGGVERPVHREDDYTIPVAGGEIAVRAYTPAGEGPFPAALQIHGGAWIMGSIDWPTFRAYARDLCERVPCVVLAVDYRLAPEAQFPVGLQDCYAALEWLFAHAEALNVDASRIAVVGDSAGGNLAAALCLMARDRSGPEVVAQVLEVPAPDHRFEGGYASWDEYGRGYGLETEGLVVGKLAYFADPNDALHPLASPLLADDLSGLPPAFVITAEFDPLRDIGEAYGRRLRDAGVPTIVSRQAGHIHGASFLLHPRWEGARRWRGEVVGALRDALVAAPYRCAPEWSTDVVRASRRSA
jgi:acetyl esterase